MFLFHWIHWMHGYMFLYSPSFFRSLQTTRTHACTHTQSWIINLTCLYVPPPLHSATCVSPTRPRWSLPRTSRTSAFVSCSPSSTCCPKPPTGGWTPSSPPLTDDPSTSRSLASCPSQWEPSPTTWSYARPSRTRRLVHQLMTVGPLCESLVNSLGLLSSAWIVVAHRPVWKGYSRKVSILCYSNRQNNIFSRFL